jgi:hypothetical protein
MLATTNDNFSTWNATVIIRPSGRYCWIKNLGWRLVGPSQAGLMLAKSIQVKSTTHHGGSSNKLLVRFDDHQEWL